MDKHMSVQFNTLSQTIVHLQIEVERYVSVKNLQGSPCCTALQALVFDVYEQSIPTRRYCDVEMVK